MNKISGFLNAVSDNSIDYMTSTRTIAQAGKDNAFVVSLDGEGGRDGGRELGREGAREGGS